MGIKLHAHNFLHGKNSSALKYTAALLLALGSCAFMTWALMYGPTVEWGSKTARPYSIEVVLKARANPPDFWRIVEQGVSMAATEFNVTCTVSGPTSEIDVDRQIELVEEALARSPDALILAAGDYERLAPVVESAVKSGVKVVMMDSDVNSDAKSSLVCTDNHEIGEKLATLLDGLIADDDQFGVVGHVENTATAIDRSRGLLESVPRCGERLAAMTYCNGFTAVAKEQTIAMLAEHPGIRCMVGLNESSALGIAQALDELGLADTVKLVACDSSQAMIQYMENGTIQAFVVQNPFNMGYLSVQAAVNVLEGKKVESVIHTDSIVITKDDMYRQENQKLLFPFTE